MEQKFELKLSGLQALGKEELKIINGGIGIGDAFAAALMFYTAASVIEYPNKVWEGFKDIFFRS